MSAAAVLAAGLAASSVAVGWPGRHAGGDSPSMGAPAVVLALAAAFLAPTRVLVPLLVTGAAAAGGVLLVRQARCRREVELVRARATGFCDELVAGLEAGLPPTAALGAAADGWELLAPATAGIALGGSVPEALREASLRAGAVDLRLVAAAWQVAHRSGGSLAPALAAVADQVRARQRTRRLVGSELAAARATARLMAGLPAFTLVLGSGTGGSPVGFLLGTPVGLTCLAGGLALALAGLAWIERIAAAVEREAQ